MTDLTFVVHGTPAPQGSKKAIIHKHTKRPVVIEQGGDRVTTWREDVKQAAIVARAEYAMPPLAGPIEVVVGFYFTRPKGHFLPVNSRRTVPELRGDAALRPSGFPDIDKLLRSTFDALTAAGVWVDDKLVVDVHATKHYAEDGPGHAGALIVVSEWLDRVVEVPDVVDVPVQGALL